MPEKVISHIGNLNFKSTYYIFLILLYNYLTLKNNTFVFVFFRSSCDYEYLTVDDLDCPICIEMVTESVRLKYNHILPTSAPQQFTRLAKLFRRLHSNIDNGGSGIWSKSSGVHFWTYTKFWGNEEWTNPWKSSSNIYSIIQWFEGIEGRANL